MSTPLSDQDISTALKNPGFRWDDLPVAPPLTKPASYYQHQAYHELEQLAFNSASVPLPSIPTPKLPFLQRRLGKLLTVTFLSLLAISFIELNHLRLAFLPSLSHTAQAQPTEDFQIARLKIRLNGLALHNARQKMQTGQYYLTASQLTEHALNLENSDFIITRYSPWPDTGPDIGTIGYNLELASPKNPSLQCHLTLGLFNQADVSAGGVCYGPNGELSRVN